MRRDARLLATFLLAIAVGGCATTKTTRVATKAHQPSAIVETPTASAKQWENTIDPEDAQRLASLPALWSSAIAATKPRYPTALAREGALLQPEGALNHPALPPGSYRCRVVTFGATKGRVPAYRASVPYFCYVGGEDSGQSFAQQTGIERPSGWLYPDEATRLVFLGAYAQGKAKPAMYGATPDHNAVGLVERIGPFRWRLVMLPTNRSTQLTVLDITPVPVEQQLKD